MIYKVCFVEWTVYDWSSIAISVWLVDYLWRKKQVLEFMMMNKVFSNYIFEGEEQTWQAQHFENAFT